MNISVIIPCFNAEPFLAHALDSVFAQTRPACEVVMANDGSTDRSVDIARRYSVRVISLSGNRGHGAARNAALAVIAGDAVAMLDADDFWEPTHLAEVGGLLERHPEAVLAAGAARAFDGRSFDLSPRFSSEPPDATFYAAFDGPVVPHSGVIFRTSALRAIGGYCESERLSVDYDLTLRLAYRSSFVATTRLTSWYRCHPGQLSSQPCLQRLAIRRHRYRFLDRLRHEGERELAAKLEQRARALWMIDLRQFAKNPRLLRAHFAEGAGGGTIPLPFWTRVGWYLRAILGSVYYSYPGKPLRGIYRKIHRAFLGRAGCAQTDPNACNVIPTLEEAKHP